MKLNHNKISCIKLVHLLYLYMMHGHTYIKFVVFNKHNTARVAFCWFIIYYILYNYNCNMLNEAQDNFIFTCYLFVQPHASIHGRQSRQSPDLDACCLSISV